MLSTQDIQREMCKYLRGYYRYRDRWRAVICETDMKARGEIIADGYFEIPRKPPEKPFIATFEVTDQGAREELRYVILIPQLLADAWMLACLSMAALYTWVYSAGWFVLADYGLRRGALLLMLFLLGLWLTWTLILSPWKRYRYIYAIEQFKSYFAHDQWIAFSSDVFPDSEKKYFKELRNQCIKNGIGLVKFSPENRHHVYATPAQDDDLGLEHQVKQFVRQSDLGVRLRLGMENLKMPERLQQGLQNMQVSKKMQEVQDGLKKVQMPASLNQGVHKVKQVALPQPVRYWWFRKVGNRKFNDLMRFQRSFLKQLILSGLGLIVIGVLYYRQVQEWPVKYEDEVAYTARMLALRPYLARHPDLPLPVIDTAFVYPFQPDIAPYLNITPVQVRRNREVVLVYTKEGKVLEYPCSWLELSESSNYLIRIGVFYEKNEARNTLLEYRRKGLPVHAFWTGCFFSGRAYYSLYFGQFYRTFSEADQVAEAYNWELDGKAMVIERFQEN